MRSKPHSFQRHIGHLADDIRSGKNSGSNGQDAQRRSNSPLRIKSAGRYRIEHRNRARIRVKRLLLTEKLILKRLTLISLRAQKPNARIALRPLHRSGVEDTPLGTLRIRQAWTRLHPYVRTEKRLSKDIFQFVDLPDRPEFRKQRRRTSLTRRGHRLRLRHTEYPTPPTTAATAATPIKLRLLLGVGVIDGTTAFVTGDAEEDCTETDSYVTVAVFARV